MSTTDPDSGWLSPILQDPDSAAVDIQGNYIFIASACLYYYDYILTLPAEIGLVWGSPQNLATSFFLAIRYGFFLQMTLRLVRNMQPANTSALNLTVEGCARSLIFLIVLCIINFAIISAFVATRLFAIYGRNWYLGTFLFILGTLSPSSLTQVASFAFRSVAAPWPLARCLSVGPDSSPWPDIVDRDGPIVLSAINMVYETLCLALTVAKTLGLYRAQRRTGISTALSSLLLRDGTLYFGVLLLLASLNIVSALAMDDLPGFWSTNTDIARVAVPILTTHFILHLRRMGQHGSGSDIDVMSTPFDSLSFADDPSDSFLESTGEVPVIEFRTRSAEQSSQLDETHGGSDR
ncbi:hypothetical protein V8D89_007106 [Ganoderma adspersum]